METEYLVHHGILGQKWGVRRYRTKSGKLTKSGKKKLRAEREEKLKNMSDQDLAAKVTRISLEKRYRELTTRTEGKDWVGLLAKASRDAISKSITKIETKLITQFGSYGIDTLMDVLGIDIKKSSKKDDDD